MGTHKIILLLISNHIQIFISLFRLIIRPFFFLYNKWGGGIQIKPPNPPNRKNQITKPLANAPTSGLFFYPKKKKEMTHFYLHMDSVI